MLSETGSKAILNSQVSEDLDAAVRPRSEYPLNPVCKAWMNKIKRALKVKEDRFQNDADEALKFYECGTKLHELMWQGATKHGRSEPAGADDEEMPCPKFRIVVGKVAELVQRFGPSIYHQNPTIVVEPKSLKLPEEMLLALIPPDQMQMFAQQAQMNGQPFNPSTLIPKDPEKPQSDVAAKVMEYMLNYMQRENKKEIHSRRMAEEALIKGAGILWTEHIEPYPDGPKQIVSTFDTIDNYVFDPDAERREEALWVARRKWLPVWEVADEWKISEDFLKEKYGTKETINSQEEGRENEDHQDEHRRGRTNDLMPVWYVYSKMGMGHKLSGINQSEIEDIEDYLDSFGDNVMLVISEKVPYPLNLHHDKMIDVLTEPDEDKQSDAYDGTFMDVQWPIPFWEFGEWPCTILAFRESPNNPWPMPYIKPAMGYLKFINWVMSFLVNKIRTSSATIVSCMKSLEDEIKDRLLSGKDFRLIEVSKDIVPDGDVQKAVHMVQFPPFQQDIYKVLEAVMDQFEKATGLSELMYGGGGGVRSAEEAKIKQQNGSAPLDDMGNRMEGAMSLVARKEAMALRWIAQPDDVQPILGKLGASMWAQYLMSKDFSSIAREYHYSIAAGSMRKLDKQAQQANITQALQGWMPALQFAMGHGNVKPVNTLWQKWCDANDFDSDGPLLDPPPPPPPDPNMLKVQAEIEGQKQESALKEKQGQMDLQVSQAKLGLEERKAQMGLQVAQAKMQMEREKAIQDLNINAAEGQQKLQLSAQEGQIKSQQLHQQGQIQAAQAAQEMQHTHVEGQLNVAQQEQQMELQREQAAQEAKQGVVKKQGKKKPKSGDKK